MTKSIYVLDEDWDNLIILDACRYDYFEKLYHPYLKGDLKKACSPGSSTIEWCKNSFQEKRDDVVYISSNPFINSKVDVLNFKALDLFHVIINVWDWGWNKELGTVHPKTVNDVVKKVKDYYSNKRFIIHYLQPHEPYLCYAGSLGFPKPKPHSWAFMSVFEMFKLDGLGQLNTLLSKMFGKMFGKLSKLSARNTKLGGVSPLWKIREFLNLPATSPLEAVRRKVGDVGLREAYADNLRFVLKYVAKIVKLLPGVTIVTSDHGERLGEGKRYSHPPGLFDPLLIEIPWFTVKNTEK